MRQIHESVEISKDRITTRRRRHGRDLGAHGIGRNRQRRRRPKQQQRDTESELRDFIRRDTGKPLQVPVTVLVQSATIRRRPTNGRRRGSAHYRRVSTAQRIEHNNNYQSSS